MANEVRKYPRLATVAVEARWLAQLAFPGVKQRTTAGLPLDAEFRYAYWSSAQQRLYMVYEHPTDPRFFPLKMVCMLRLSVSLVMVLVILRIVVSMVK